MASIISMPIFVVDVESSHRSSHAHVCKHTSYNYGSDFSEDADDVARDITSLQLQSNASNRAGSHLSNNLAGGWAGDGGFGVGTNLSHLSTSACMHAGTDCDDVNGIDVTRSLLARHASCCTHRTTESEETDLNHPSLRKLAFRPEASANTEQSLLSVLTPGQITDTEEEEHIMDSVSRNSSVACGCASREVDDRDFATLKSSGLLNKFYSTCQTQSALLRQRVLPAQPRMRSDCGRQHAWLSMPAAEHTLR